MALVVDRYELGPIGTNCYVVRSERGAAEAVVVDPSGEAATIRLGLASLGATCGALLSGDVLFAGSVGRTDLPRGDWDELLTSIRTLVERFPPDTVVYSGHGPPTTLGDEVQRNPFLQELRA